MKKGVKRSSDMGAPLPPPPPPPAMPTLQQGNRDTNPKLQPQHAAVPIGPPIQETNPSPAALSDLQGEEAPPVFLVQNGSPSSEGQEDSQSDNEEKYHPVQETEPAPQAHVSPQTTEQQEEQDPNSDPEAL